MYAPDIVTKILLAVGVHEVLVLPSVFAGIKTPMLTMLRTRNMLRHILVNLRNTVPSSPTFSTSCASVVLFTGVNQAKRLLPISGGACFSSAYLSLGAYTTELRGRSKENIRVIKTITPTEVPKDAQKAVAANWDKLSVCSNMARCKVAYGCFERVLDKT